MLRWIVGIPFIAAFVWGQGVSALADDGPPEDDVRFAFIDGTVLDESGKPVAGAVVRILTFSDSAEIPQCVTDGQGRFLLNLQTPILQFAVVTASDVGGKRQGSVTVAQPGNIAERRRSVEITLYPPREIRVTVRDADGVPIEDAHVEIIDSMLTLAHARTDSAGLALFRVPADAELNNVIAYQSKRGFAYWDKLNQPQGEPRPEPPAEFSLTLNGATTASVRVVGKDGKPVVGVPIRPWFLAKKEMSGNVNLSASRFGDVQTNAEGIAIFDWLPADFTGKIPFITPRSSYSTPERVSLKDTEEAREFTLPVLKSTKITGRVLGFNGKPAPGILLQAEGRGVTRDYCRAFGRTDSDGNYEIPISADQVYIVAIINEHWAAANRVGLLSREEEPITGVDFRLNRGTLIRGTVSGVKPPQTPAYDSVALTYEFGESPQLPKVEMGLVRWANVGADGYYSFRVGPGEYELFFGSPMGNRIPLKVGAQAEVVQDFQR